MWSVAYKSCCAFLFSLIFIITLLDRPPLILVILDWSYCLYRRNIDRLYRPLVSTACIDHLGIVYNLSTLEGLGIFLSTSKRKLKERRQRKSTSRIRTHNIMNLKQPLIPSSHFAAGAEPCCSYRLVPKIGNILCAL